MQSKIIAVVVLLLWFATIFAPSLNPVRANDAPPKNERWKRAKDNAFPGVINEMVYQYRIDRNARLWWKPDAQGWIPDEDSMWTDIEGSFYKIEGTKLVWSPDGANSWFDSKEWKWLAVDSNWYRIDQNWVVWVKKNSGHSHHQ